MNYRDIDPDLMAWAARHDLHLYTDHRDEPVRSVDVVSKGGMKVQIWVDPPDSDGIVGVHVWDYRRRRLRFMASVDSLSLALDRALASARDWLRTP
jgi:hypothetical protein